jgi:hypothetical protein
LGEQQHPAGGIGGRCQQGGGEPAGDRPELLGGRPRPDQVTCGERHLDLGGEQLRAAQGVTGLSGDRHPEGAPGHLSLPLREPQEGRPRLGLEPELLRPSEGLFGGREVPRPATGLARYVPRGARGRGVDAHQLVRRSRRFLLRLAPGPPEDGHLSPVDAAQAGKMRLRGNGLAPCSRRITPLPRAPDVAELQTRLDHVAVDDPGEEGADLSRQDRRHRLIEQGDAFGNPARGDVGQALDVDRHRDQVAVPEALPDLGRVRGEPQGALGVAGETGHICFEHRQEAVLDALGLFAEVSLRAHEPTAGDGRLLTGEVVHAEAPGHPRRRAIIGPGGEGRVCLLPGGDGFLPLGDPPGRVRQPLEVAGTQPGRIDGAEQLVGLAPRSPGDRCTGPIDVGGQLGQGVPASSVRTG